MSVSITFDASNGTELSQEDVINIANGHTGGNFTAIIGDNVEKIASWAFEGGASPNTATYMISVIIPKTVTELGNRVFNNCTNLAEAEIHRYVNDNTSTPLIQWLSGGLTSSPYNPPFNNCASPFTIKIHSDTYWDGTTYGDPNNILGIVPTEALLEYIIIDGTTTIAADEFKDKNLIKATIPDSVTSIGDYAFSGVNGYQYVFIEIAGDDITGMWLGIDDIEIFDTQGNKVSQNGNWVFNSSSGEMTTTDGDAFYYTESYHPTTSTYWQARRMVNGLIAASSANESDYFGIIGYHNVNRSYQLNVFESQTNHYNDQLMTRTPYCVFKFNEPKDIGKIIIHSMRRSKYNNSTGDSTSNHNIYLANNDSVTMATMPVDFFGADYVTPTIPWISGTNYRSIMNSSSGVNWVGTALNYQYLKQYDFSTTPLNFSMSYGPAYKQNPLEIITFTGNSNLESIGEGCFKHTKISSITLPNTVTTIGNSAFENCSNLSSIFLSKASYQYVFIEAITDTLHMAEIEVFDIAGIKISQNGTWTLNTSTGDMTTTNGDAFYFSEMRVGHTGGNKDANSLLDGLITTITDQEGVDLYGIVGNIDADNGGNGPRSYQRNCFESATETGDDTPYCVLKFNEPKYIGKIVIHCRRSSQYNSETLSYSSNHNIYLANDSDISSATRPNGYAHNSYTTPTIPWISGTNYKSILHSTSGVSWGTTASGTSSNSQYDKTYDFSTASFAFTFNTPSSLTTIGASCFKNSVLNSIAIPKSVTAIGDYAFANNPLTSADIHTYTNDVITDSVTIGNKIFSLKNNLHDMVPFELTVHSDRNRNDEFLQGRKYQYVFYSRDCVNQQLNSTIAEFEVWDNNDNRISHTLDPTIIWSSRWEPDTGYQPEFINSGILNTNHTSEWHCRQDNQSVKNVFGSTEGTFRNSFIGYDFGTPQNIKKIVLSACGATSYSHENNLAGSSTDKASKINGYKLYFTNDVITVPTNDSNYTTVNYTCVDPDKDYVVIDSYNNGTYVDATYDTYTHDFSSSISVNYNIITDIPPQAFSDDEYLKTITLEDSVTDIGDSAFENVTNLESVTCTPTSQLESIGASCFKECYKLNSLTIPNSVTSLGSYFIDKCYLLTSVNIPTNPNFTTITNHCFNNCGMTSVTIPDNVSTLGTSAFSGNEPNYFQYVFIEAYTIGQNLKLAEIEIWDVFGNKISQNGNWDVDTVNPNSVTPEVITTTNGDNFYYSCTKTAHTSTPFGSPIHLDSDSLPSNMVNGVVPTNLETGCIVGNGSAEYAYQPNCFETDDIRPYCVIKFNEPKIISRIVVHNFRNSDYNVISAHNIHLANDDSVTMATMPAGFFKPDWVTSEIPYISGSNYTSIKAESSNVPWTDPGYGSWRLYKEYKFTPWNFSEEVTTLSRITECLFSGTPIVSTIGESCFYSSSLSNISIPDSVTDIKRRAFFSCRNLTSCTLPINSNFTTITEDCFRSSGLTSITIPDSVTTIESAAFYFATSLGPCILPNSVTSLGDNTFEGTTSMTSCTLPINNNFTTIPGWCFKVSGLTSIMIPDSVTTIGTWAFENNPLTSFSLPNNPSFTSIPAGCFFRSIYWTSLQSIPFQVTSVGSGAFTTDHNVHLNDNETYLKLPRGLKAHVDSPGSYTTKYDSRINLELDHFGPFKTNNNSVLVKFESSGSSNEIVFSAYKINGTSLGNFRKGIVNESLYNYTLLSNTLQPFYDIYPYAVAGDIGYIWSGGDIGKRIAPYYKIYTSSTNNVKLISGWTKVGILAIGGGGGGQSGYAQQGGVYYGGGGGGAGGMAFGYFTQNEITPINLELEITIGDGGSGGTQRSSNGNGNQGSSGGDTKVKYNYAGGSSATIVEATGGEKGIAYNDGGNGGTGSKSINGGIFISGQSGTGNGGASEYDSPNGVYQGGNGGAIENGNYTFNLEHLTGTGAGTGHGGAGGRGDTPNDYGIGGSSGSKGSVGIFQYFT